MKKRKGSLLQRMMAVLLAAVLVVCMVSNEAPATVLADEPVSVSENTPEPVEGETEPAQGEDADGQEDSEAAESEEETKPEEPKQELPKPEDRTEEDAPEQGSGTEEKTPGTDTEKEPQETVSGNDAAPKRVMRAAEEPQADNSIIGGSEAAGWILTADGKLTIKSDAGMVNWGAYGRSNYSSKVTGAEIQDGVTVIQGMAFNGCSGMKNITIPETVASIGPWAFLDCSSLTSITIPSNVGEIGDAAFGRCSGLTTVTMLRETPPTSGDDVFGLKQPEEEVSCGFIKNNTQGIHVPAGTAEAYKAAEGWKNYKEYIAEDPVSEDEHKHDGVTFTPWTKADSLPTDAGNYYLTENVTLTSTWWVPSGETTLCLNGKTISGSGNNVIGIGGSITLNLYDCQREGNITGGEDNAVWINNNGAFYMYGGEISGNDWNGSSTNSSAVYVRGGTFYMHGGNISGNTARGSGGVYIMNSGTFKMYGGEISGNTAQYGSGVYVGTNCTFQMQGGEITNNTVTTDYGGGVFSYGNITVGGEAKITGNKTGGAAGNVYLKRDKTIEVLTDTPLTGSAKIGVTTETAPTEGNPVNVTGHNKGDYSEFFVSDNPAYEIINESDTVKLILSHRHTPVKQEKVPADCTHPGTGEYWKCEGTTGCGKLFLDQACTQEISTKPVLPALGHSYDSAWKKDASGHWYECSRCGEKKEQAEHTYDDDSDTDCDICGYQRTAAHTHTLTRVDAKSATCTEDGNTAYYVCGGNDGCGKYFSDAAGKQEITDKNSVKIPKTGHDFDVLTWGYKEADGHAHKCRNCNEHDTVSAHTPGTAATEETPQTCTECGYIIAPAIEHTHEYGEWQHDSTQHWKVCTCGAEIDRGNHEFGNWVTDKEATATEAGTKHRDCRICAYRETETIPKKGGGSKPGGGSGGGSDHSGVSGNSDGGNHNNDNGGGNGSGSSGGSSAGNTGGTGTGNSKKPGASGTGQPKVKQEKEGNIRKEVRVEGENTLDAAVETPLSKLADMVLTKEEKQKAADGTDIRIVLDVKDASAVVGAADKTLVEAALNGSLAKGYTMGQYLAISLYKVIGNSRTDITETDGKITVRIDVPDSLKNTDATKTRIFAVIRVHGGKAELLTDLDNNEDTITIATDRFSTYAVVYKDTADGNSVVRISVQDGSKKSGSAKDDEPKTGDSTPIELCATLSMIAGFAYLFLYFADRERGMTEETKKELVSRLAAWAKQGGRIRKYLALAAIFVLLVYYHSIGKKMSTEWEAVYGE